MFFRDGRPTVSWFLHFDQSLSTFDSVQEPRPWNGAVYIPGDSPPSVKWLWNGPLTDVPRDVLDRYL